MTLKEKIKDRLEGINLQLSSLTEKRDWLFSQEFSDIEYIKMLDEMIFAYESQKDLLLDLLKEG